MKILLIDDNLMSSMRIENALRSAGHNVKLARKIAPEMADFDAVILNFGSRSMDGFTLLETAKTQLSNATFYGFCGHREVEIWRRAQENGAKMVSNERAMNGEIF